MSIPTARQLLIDALIQERPTMPEHWLIEYVDNYANELADTIRDASCCDHGTCPGNCGPILADLIRPEQP